MGYPFRGLSEGTDQPMRSHVRSFVATSLKGISITLIVDSDRVTLGIGEGKEHTAVLSTVQDGIEVRLFILHLYLIIFTCRFVLKMF